MLIKHVAWLPKRYRNKTVMLVRIISFKITREEKYQKIIMVPENNF